MKKRYWIIGFFLLFLSIQAKGQAYVTREGQIRFFSSTPLENIEATNSQVVALLQTDSMRMVWVVPIERFHFRKALMREHFNENYMETDKYPTAEYRGTLLGIQASDLQKEGTYKVQTQGQLTMHGVSKEIEAAGTVEVTKEQLILRSSFSVLLKDYNIKIPKIVLKNIAEEIKIDVEARMTPYEK